MQKNFACVFGTHRSSSAMAALLGSYLDLCFIECESSHGGIYFRYSGVVADKLTIETNAAPRGCAADTRFCTFPTLIFLSNFDGGNAHKLGKTNYLKQHFATLSDVVLIQQQIYPAEAIS